MGFRAQEIGDGWVRVWADDGQLLCYAGWPVYEALCRKAGVLVQAPEPMAANAVGGGG